MSKKIDVEKFVDFRVITVENRRIFDVYVTISALTTQDYIGPQLGLYYSLIGISLVARELSVVNKINELLDNLIISDLFTAVCIRDSGIGHFRVNSVEPNEAIDTCTATKM